MIALPDINVLLALAWSNHSHHEAAHRWFARDAAAGWATYLLTQTGFRRLSLNLQDDAEVESFRCETRGSALTHHAFHECTRQPETSPVGQER